MSDSREVSSDIVAITQGSRDAVHSLRGTDQLPERIERVCDALAAGAIETGISHVTKKIVSKVDASCVSARETGARGHQLGDEAAEVVVRELKCLVPPRTEHRDIAVGI